MGKLNYMLPIYSTANSINMGKLHKVITTAARAAIGNYCYKKSITYILGKCKWLDISQLLSYSCLTILHKTIKTELPETTFSLFRDTSKNRTGKEISTIYVPTTVKFSNFYIYKYVKAYNLFDTKVKAKSVASFKKHLKLELLHRPISDTMD